MNSVIKISLLLSLLTLTACQTPSNHNHTVTDSKTLSLNASVAAVSYLENSPAVKDISNWSYDNAPGLIVTTENYIIYTTLLEPLMLRQIPAFMEAAHSAYQDQLPEKIQTPTKFTVYIFANRSQWENFTKEFTAPNAAMYMKIKRGAYYLNGAVVAYNIGRTRTFSVLGHEGWHQFNSRHFTFRLPSWLDEGIATLFESSSYANGKFSFHPDKNSARLAALKSTILADRMIPLNQLIALNPGQVVKDSAATLAFYSQSHALVRFLREDNYGKRLSNYHNLLLAGLRGNWPLTDELKKIAADRNTPLTVNFNSFISPKLFDLYIDRDMNKIQDEYLRFCNKIVYHVKLKK